MKRFVFGICAAGLAAVFALSAVLVAGCESADSYEISVSPNYAKLRAGQSISLVARGWNNYHWSVSPSGGGHLSRTTGDNVVFYVDSGAGSNVTFTITAAAVGSGSSSSSTNSTSAAGYTATAKIDVE